MAIQAGRVGVDPSQVTLSGKIKGGGVSPEVLTKEEAARIYQTILGMSAYLQKTEANSLYQKIVDMALYQLKLVSGQNIKRINGEDLLGSGNISVLTTQLADGIYQKISDMDDYVLRSEIPDLSDVLTKTEAPGYNDILTRTVGLPLINGKFSVDGSTVSYKTNAYDFNNFVSGVAFADTTCLNLPSADEWLVVSSGSEDNRVQIALSSTSMLSFLIRTLSLVNNVPTWSSWRVLPYNRYLDGVDLNTVKYSYKGYAYSSCTNKPGSYGGAFECFMDSATNSQYGVQIFYTNLSDGSGNIFFRGSSPNGWTAWRPLEKSYSVGDRYTITQNTTIIPGVITGSGTVRFRIQLPKTVSAQATPSITELAMNISDNSGIVRSAVNPITDTANYSISYSIDSNRGGVNVILTGTTPFSPSSKGVFIQLQRLTIDFV